MAERPITDDLLNLIIESKVEAGVGPSAIRTLISAVASEEQAHEPTGGIVGYLRVEDIQQNLRGPFLIALLALSEGLAPGHAVRMLRGLFRRPTSRVMSTDCKHPACIADDGVRTAEGRCR